MFRGSIFENGQHFKGEPGRSGVAVALDFPLLILHWFRHIYLFHGGTACPRSCGRGQQTCAWCRQTQRPSTSRWRRCWRCRAGDDESAQKYVCSHKCFQTHCSRKILSIVDRQNIFIKFSKLLKSILYCFLFTKSFRT